MSYRVGIRDLRADLAGVVRRAGNGERTVVTVDGIPVAQIAPLDGGSAPVSLDDLVVRGLVVAPRRTDRPEPPDPIPAWIGSRLDRLLSEVRG